MSLEVTSRRPIVAYLLDSEHWGSASERPDGLLVADAARGEPASICFVEIKGAIDPEEADRPFEQIEAGVRHFHPDTHGREHHEQWSNGVDLPSAARGRRHIEIRPEADHDVRGIILTSRGGTRYPPRTIQLSGKDIPISVVQCSGSYGEVKCSLRELYRRAGSK
ncbi:MAG: hypothetical protein JXR96_02100 [Deltaproteobacteria bacterium]|nr:hypothetical protein [Deltaproteobacteria bacterium]